jgi:5-hydroxyisourate hydrolase
VTHPAELGLSTHVLDTSTGRPAPGVHLELHALHGGTWKQVHTTHTDSDGRAQGLSKGPLEAGDYRLQFDTGSWFAKQGIECFFPSVTIEFRVSDTQRHHHVPLLLSPFGYSTYRGS